MLWLSVGLPSLNAILLLYKGDNVHDFTQQLIAFSRKEERTIEFNPGVRRAIFTILKSED